MSTNNDTLVRASFNSFHDDIDHTYRTENTGGTIRVSAPPPKELYSAPAWSPTRVCSGPVRMTAGFDSEAQYVNQQNASGPVRAVHSYSGTAGGSVAATMQNIGGQRTVELIPGNPATRTNVTLALREGLIEADGQGGFRDSGNVARAAEGPQAVAAPAPAAAPAQAPVEAPEPLHEAFDAEDMSLWAQDIEPLPQQAYDSAVNRTMAAVVNGGEGSLDGALSRVANELAQQAGIDQKLAAEYVQSGAAMYQRTVERALEKAGMVGDEDTQPFYKWLRQVKQPEMQHALQQLVHKNDPSYFVRLGVQWQGHKANRL